MNYFRRFIPNFSFFPRHPIFASFFLTLAIVAAFCTAFEPRFETNDDVAMSMLAHGYGAFIQGSPNLVFSNVIWGWLVRSIPSIFGLLGYSLATVAVLFMVTWAILNLLILQNVDRFTATLVVILIMARPILFPQFTINAGLLTVVAILSLIKFLRDANLVNLVFFVVLAYLGFLIRKNEFYLVLFVAIPFLPWREICKQRKVWLTFLLLCLGILVSNYVDKTAYRTADWQVFSALNQARIPFNDFGVSEYLKVRSDITNRYGFSHNDLDLIRYWFFVDSKIADPNSLNDMVRDLGPIQTFLSIDKAVRGLKVLVVSAILPVCIAALFLLFLSRLPQAGVAWCLFLCIVFITGLLGRPGVTRIFIPLISLLLIAPLFFDYSFIVHKRIITLIICGACGWNLLILKDEQRNSTSLVEQTRGDLEKVPEGIIVKWGGDFLIEYAFPVLGRNMPNSKIQFYTLGSFTQVPSSIAFSEAASGHDLITQLLSDDGIRVISSADAALQPKLNLLSIYCNEHYQGQLYQVMELKTPSFFLNRVKCVAKKSIDNKQR